MHRTAFVVLFALVIALAALYGFAATAEAGIVWCPGCTWPPGR
jgi:hypothetical protein